MTIQEEIQLGESRTLEFKKELPAESLKWIKTIAAFANGAGGRLVIGVSNQREIIGISKETDILELKDKISDTISQMCTPQLMYDIYQESIENKVLIVVEVFLGNDTPYFIKSFGKENGTFSRLDATTRNADITTIDELEFRGKRRYYDELPFTELDVTENDIATLCNEFSKRAKHESYDNPFIGTDFHLVKFSDLFTLDEEKGKISFTKEKMILMDDSNPETQENKSLEAELKNTDWYMLDSFWGTSEERKLIEFIKSHESNLEEKYDSFQLLRNEEVYKIFDFDTGRGFQPDFLLLLHGKQNGQNAYYQVFIEPKGKHLAGEDNDG